MILSFQEVLPIIGYSYYSKRMIAQLRGGDHFFVIVFASEMPNAKLVITKLIIAINVSTLNIYITSSLLYISIMDL